MKSIPAFDSPALQTPENVLFRDAETSRKHFIEFDQQHGSGDSIADPVVVKMMNPMYYIDGKGITTATDWRIRHGALDRGTSLAVPVMLATKRQNSGRSMDLAVAWGTGTAVTTNRMSSSPGSIRSAARVSVQLTGTTSRLTRSYRLIKPRLDSFAGHRLSRDWAS
jgi:hypothetical protein